jgi:preprotein translocase subunit SecG
MVHTLVLVVHVLAAAALIALILIQQGKGADAGAAFGSGASATVFGSRGSASFLTRSTGILAFVFFVTSLTLAYLSGQVEKEPTSVMDTVPGVEQVREAEPTAVPEVPAEPAPETAPATPETDVPTVN